MEQNRAEMECFYNMKYLRAVKCDVLNFQT